MRKPHRKFDGGGAFSNDYGDQSYQLIQPANITSDLYGSNGQMLFDWLTSQGVTKQDGSFFQPGDVVAGTPASNGQIQFTAYSKSGQPFTTAWSANYFIPVAGSYYQPPFTMYPPNNYYNQGPNELAMREAQQAAYFNAISPTPNAPYLLSQQQSQQPKLDPNPHGHMRNAEGSADSSINVKPNANASAAIQGLSHLKVTPLNATQYVVLKGKLKGGGVKSFTGQQLIINKTEVDVVAHKKGAEHRHSNDIGVGPHINAEGVDAFSNAAGDTSAPVAPILAPEMVAQDKSKICLPCATVALALVGAGAAFLVNKKKHFGWKAYAGGILAGAIAGYGLGLGINKLKK